MRSFYSQTGTSEPIDYTHYLYDSAGNRVKKTVRKQSSGDAVVSVYIDGSFEHRYKYDSSSRSEENNEIHVMDGRSRIARVRVGIAFTGDSSDDVIYNLEDHLGNSSITLNASNGSLISKEEYFPFGETSFGSFAKKRYRFCGKERDEESGLYYYGARYYAPWVCRFVSVDPLAGKYPFYTPYQYAGNMPINYIDLDGAEPAKTELGPKERAKYAERPGIFDFASMTNTGQFVDHLIKVLAYVAYTRPTQVDPTTGFDLATGKPPTKIETGDNQFTWSEFFNNTPTNLSIKDAHSNMSGGGRTQATYTGGGTSYTMETNQSGNTQSGTWQSSLIMPAMNIILNITNVTPNSIFSITNNTLTPIDIIAQPFSLFVKDATGNYQGFSSTPPMQLKANGNYLIGVSLTGNNPDGSQAQIHIIAESSTDTSGNPSTGPKVKDGSILIQQFMAPYNEAGGFWTRNNYQMQQKQNQVNRQKNPNIAQPPSNINPKP